MLTLKDHFWVCTSAAFGILRGGAGDKGLVSGECGRMRSVFDPNLLSLLPTSLSCATVGGSSSCQSNGVCQCVNALCLKTYSKLPHCLLPCEAASELELNLVGDWLWVLYIGLNIVQIMEYKFKKIFNILK